MGILERLAEEKGVTGEVLRAEADGECGCVLVDNDVYTLTFFVGLFVFFSCARLGV